MVSNFLRHSRESGNPVSRRKSMIGGDVTQSDLDSRFRGNDNEVLMMRISSCH